MRSGFAALLVLAGLLHCLSAHAAPMLEASDAALARLVLVNAAKAGSRVVAVSSRGAILTLQEPATRWRHADTPASAPLTAVGFADALTGIAVGHRASILRTADGGLTWRRIKVDADSSASFLDVVMIGMQHAFAVGAFGLYFDSSDGGMTWRRQTIADDDLHFNAVASDGRDTVVIVGEQGIILRSADRGRSWVRAAGAGRASLFGIVHAAGQRFIAFGLGGKILLSTDDGRSWQPLAGASTQSLMGGSLLEDGSIVLVGASGTILRASHGDASFQLIARAFDQSYAAVVPVAGSRLLLFGKNGVNQFDLRKGSAIKNGD